MISCLFIFFHLFFKGEKMLRAFLASGGGHMRIPRFVLLWANPLLFFFESTADTHTKDRREGGDGGREGGRKISLPPRYFRPVAPLPCHQHELASFLLSPLFDAASFIPIRRRKEGGRIQQLCTKKEVFCVP